MLDLSVGGMNSEHCIRTVTEAVSAVPGVLGVSVDLNSGQVRVQGQADAAAVRHAITEEGYTLP